MIVELLNYGQENARTGRELADVLNCEIREVTRAIERERRNGEPICASTDPKQPGYYLPADAEELERYTNEIKHRAIELFKTRQALVRVLKQIKLEK